MGQTSSIQKYEEKRASVQKLFRRSAGALAAAVVLFAGFLYGMLALLSDPVKTPSIPMIAAFSVFIGILTISIVVLVTDLWALYVDLTTYEELIRMKRRTEETGQRNVN